MMIALLLALGAIAGAETPKPVFAQDPLCTETQDHFKNDLAKARPLHLKYPQLRAATESQTKWFNAVTGEMKSICTADVKFASELLKKARPDLTGQCKPAAEAAIADQEVLEHSEASLKILKNKKEEFLLKGENGGVESLWSIFEKDFYRVDVDALEMLEIPRSVACELRWIYPQAFLKKKVPFLGCAEAPPGVKLGAWDKKDGGIFAQLMTRFDLSLEYNAARRNNAMATAIASKARYDSCVGENPGTVNVFTNVNINVMVKGTSGQGSGAIVPKGESPVSGSDITGVEDDQKKQKQ